jgi:hypothetical protein
LNGQQNGLATSDLATAVKAAKFGQVETMFVPLDEQRWERHEAENNQVIFKPKAERDNEDLLNLAAAETILNSGQVFAVPRRQLPGHGDLAAILRFALNF